jgi:hypothetical protein
MRMVRCKVILIAFNFLYWHMLGSIFESFWFYSRSSYG